MIKFKHLTFSVLLFFLSSFLNAATIYVDVNASGTNAGTSWTNAYTSLQSAVSNAVSGDEVWVAAGTYKPSAYPTGRTSSDTREYAFYLESGVSYYGGFVGTETTRSQRDYSSNVTILSGDIGTANSSSDNCYHVLVSVNESTAIRLDGFTITKGNATDSVTFSEMVPFSQKLRDASEVAQIKSLIENKTVSGWDDPRMPTISGLRRRGYTPQALRNFVETAGVSKRENVIDVSLLEYCVREDLNSKASRVMAVLDPIKLVITNYPEGATEMLEAVNNPEDESKGSRLIPFSKNLFIERDDFKEEANRKYFRLTLGKEVRLKSAYIIEGQSVVKDSAGNIIEIHCTYDSDSKSGSGSEASQRKVKGTIHWVSQDTSISAQVNVYDRLFSDESPDQHKDQDFTEFINRDSLGQLTAKVEPSLVNLLPGTNVQFQRLGYFVTDINSTSDNLIFNKTAGLRDTWSKKSN